MMMNAMNASTSYNHHYHEQNGVDIEYRNIYSRYPQNEEDMSEVASFLLTLKHRSVTPEPPSADDSSTSTTDRTNEIPDKTSSSFQPCNYANVSNEQSYQERAPSLMDEHSVGDMPWEVLLGDSKLVHLKDRDLVPDALFVAMAQMKPCKLSQADRVGCYKSREIGFVGMSCKHCGGQPGFGRYYPNSVRSLAQTTTSQTILKHVGFKCRFCPPHIRQAVLDLQGQQAAREGMSSGRPRYGSRKVFFQRVWARLHGGPIPEDDDNDSKEQDHQEIVNVSKQTAHCDVEEDENQHSSSDDECNDSKQCRKQRLCLPTHQSSKRKSHADGRSAKRSRHVAIN